MTFNELGLSEKVLAAVTGTGYTTPTPIQAQAIPHVLEGRDVIGIAQTGTGKTASFTLPMLTLLERGRARARMPRTLILEPTRELAAQVEAAFNIYGAQHKLNVALLIGGVSFEEQDRKLTRGVDVLIATPGRMLDLFERGKLLLGGVEVLVIDEADRMLDMGFIPDVEKICRLIPPKRQTLFFSATMPPEIQRLTESFLRDPVRIEVARPATAAATITQLLAASAREPGAKRERLRDLLRGAEGLQNALIFCNRKRDIATVQRSLAQSGFNVGALHGDMDQRARTTTLERFRSGELPMLVASDVAARGLDIPAVSHVFNFDVPIHAEDYVHRIGRTGRAGRSGNAVTIVTPEEMKHVAAIEKLIGQPIVWSEEPAGTPTDTDAEAPPRRASRRKPAEKAAPRRASSRSPEAARRATEEAPRGAAEQTPRRAEPSRRGAEEPSRRAAETPRRGASETPRRSQEGPRRSSNRSQSDRRPDREGDETVVGLGDHVPAFLLRPVNASRR